jgi:tripartite-type tricarboxylate transporter receptor subunit TctC
VVRVLNRQEVKGRLLNAGIEVFGSSPAELKPAMAAEMAQLGKIIKSAQIKAD